MQNTGALKGITVLDLSRLLPGPYCSMILADHGARVIAIEDKKQYAKDGLFLPMVQRNKRHMSLDLKTNDGRAVFYRMLETADVVLEGFRPGVTARLGVDYATVKAKKPDIIYCSVTGYGQTGPYRDRAGHDVNYLATAGILDVMGEADRPPSIPGIQLADIAGGGMNAAIGILLALFARERTGQGQVVDISMTDGMLSLLPVSMFLRQITGKAPERADSMLSHRYACYNTYETADGRAVCIGAVESRFWRTLCEHLGFADFIPLQYDDTRRDEITAAFRNVFRQKTLAAWETELRPLDACAEGVRTLDEALENPLFHARQMVVTLPDADGHATPALGVPIKLSETPGAVRTPPVAFGQNTREILTEYGYTGAEIDKMTEGGIV
ncbi:MAG: CaiB/BaiF CoA-transferase family protein [Pseudomonadota bacterium]